MDQTPDTAAAAVRPRIILGDVEAILALGSLLVFAGALTVVLFWIVPAVNEKYVMLMLGALIGVVKDTFGRYFQATKGSQDQRREFTELAVAAAGNSGVTAPAATTQNVTVTPAHDPVAPIAPADTDLAIPPKPPEGAAP